MADLDDDLINNQATEDCRIECSNSRYLDKILETAVRHVTKLADSYESDLGDSKSQYVSRFTEVFKNTIQENVTVNGLPWVVNKGSLSTVEKQEQTQETTDALLSKLSKTLEETAHKRKNYPKECCRIYNMQLKHERQNLKMAKIEHSVSLPSTSFQNPSQPLPLDDFRDVYSNITQAHINVQNQAEKLEKVQKKIEFANNIVERQKPHLESLYDTGYISE